MLYYGAGEVAAANEHYFVLPLIFILVALTFVPLARPLGRLLNALPPLQAYAIDIAGSLAGIAVFFVMSYLALPPLVWFALLALALLPLLRPREIWLALPCLLATLFVVYQLGIGSFWSPYYRIQVYPNQLGGYVGQRQQFRPPGDDAISRQRDVLLPRLRPAGPARRSSACWCWAPAPARMSQLRCTTAPNMSTRSRSTRDLPAWHRRCTPTSPTPTRA